VLHGIISISVTHVAEKVLVDAIFIFGLENAATFIWVIHFIVIVPPADCLKKKISALLRARVFRFRLEQAHLRSKHACQFVSSGA